MQQMLILLCVCVFRSGLIQVKLKLTDSFMWSKERDTSGTVLLGVYMTIKT